MESEGNIITYRIIDVGNNERVCIAASNQLYRKEGELYFYHRWLLTIGVKR